LGSLAICTVLYIAVALVLTGIVKYTELNVPDPIAVGINAAGAGLAWLRPIIKIGAIAGLSSVILVMLLGQPRIFYTMSKDGLLPPLFGRVHPKYRTPWVASAITGGTAMVLAVCSRLGCSASWCRSGHCWRSLSSAPGCWCYGTPIRTRRGRSGRRWCRSCRLPVFFPASI
jgi:amino acid transporter